MLLTWLRSTQPPLSGAAGAGKGGRTSGRERGKGRGERDARALGARGRSRRERRGTSPERSARAGGLFNRGVGRVWSEKPGQEGNGRPRAPTRRHPTPFRLGAPPPLLSLLLPRKRPRCRGTGPARPRTSGESRDDRRKHARGPGPKVPVGGPWLSRLDTAARHRAPAPLQHWTRRPEPLAPLREAHSRGDPFRSLAWSWAPPVKLQPSLYWALRLSGPGRAPYPRPLNSRLRASPSVGSPPQTHKRVHTHTGAHSLTHTFPLFPHATGAPSTLPLVVQKKPSPSTG